MKRIENMKPGSGLSSMISMTSTVEIVAACC
jgi:hypothetical protein